MIIQRRELPLVDNAANRASSTPEALGEQNHWAEKELETVYKRHFVNLDQPACRAGLVWGPHMSLTSRVSRSGEHTGSSFEPKSNSRNVTSN